MKKEQTKSEGNQKNMLPKNSLHLASNRTVAIHQQGQILQHFKTSEELNLFSKIIEHNKEYDFYMDGLCFVCIKWLKTFFKMCPSLFGGHRQQSGVLGSTWWRGGTAPQSVIQPRLRARQQRLTFLRPPSQSFFYLLKPFPVRKGQTPEILTSLSHTQPGMEYNPVMASKHKGKLWERPFAKNFHCEEMVN